MNAKDVKVGKLYKVRGFSNYMLIVSKSPPPGGGSRDGYWIIRDPSPYLEFSKGKIVHSRSIVFEKEQYESEKSKKEKLKNEAFETASKIGVAKFSHNNHIEKIKSYLPKHPTWEYDILSPDGYSDKLYLNIRIPITSLTKIFEEQAKQTDDRFDNIDI